MAGSAFMGLRQGQEPDQGRGLEPEQEPEQEPEPEPEQTQPM